MGGVKPLPATLVLPRRGSFVSDVSTMRARPAAQGPKTLETNQLSINVCCLEPYVCAWCTVEQKVQGSRASFVHHYIRALCTLRCGSPQKRDYFQDTTTATTHQHQHQRQQKPRISHKLNTDNSRPLSNHDKRPASAPSVPSTPPFPPKQKQHVLPSREEKKKKMQTNTHPESKKTYSRIQLVHY